MKTNLTLFVVCFIHCNSATAQSLRYSLAQPAISLSAYSQLQNDPLSFTGNQAALAQTKHSGFGIYSERRFMLKETSAYSLAAALPTRMGNFGLQLNYSGFKNFSENKIGLAYARGLGKKVNVGVQFNYYGYRVPVYGNASSINFEIGVLIHLTDKLITGVHVYNPVGGKMGKNGDEKLASVYKIGLGYDASENFFISSEVIKEEDKTVRVTAGLLYRFAKQFFAKAGFVSETGSVYGGAGVGWKELRLDISATYHAQLGFSPGILLIMNFKARVK